MRIRAIRTIALILILLIALTTAVQAAEAPSATDVPSPSDAPPAETQETPSLGEVIDEGIADVYSVSGLSASQITDDMHLGISLGGSLDSWASGNGYSNYHNASAYQLMVMYYNGDSESDACVPYTFKEDNTCTINWDTDFIMSCKPQTSLGKIGFVIINRTVKKPTPIKINVKTAYLAKKTTQIAHNIDELLGEHDMVISRYGTTSLFTEKFPSHLTKTLGVQGSHYKLVVELLDYPERSYTKEQYYETLSKNPEITPELIEMLKGAGYNTVRIPITFFNHVNESNVVDSAWLDRIEEIVCYVLSRDMYCIVDMYNDSDASDGWLEVPSPFVEKEGKKTKAEIQEEEKQKAEKEEKEKKMLETYESIWKQLSKKLSKYGDHLLFEAYNEITNEEGEWGWPGNDAIEWTKKLNQLFVDTVRASGGNNAERCLLIPTYAGSNDSEIISAFTLPSDKAKDRLIAAVHAYTPATFSWHYEDDKEVTAWGTDDDRKAVDKLFERLDSGFTQKNIPVVICEFGTVEKLKTGVYENYAEEAAQPADSGASGTDSEGEAQPETNISDRIAHARYYTSKANQYRVPCLWFDDGSFINRDEYTFVSEELSAVMVEEMTVHLDRLKIQPIEKQYYTGEPITPSPVIYDPADSPVTYTDGSGKKLKQGDDFLVTYSSNVSLGTAKITVYGRGKYSGSRTVTFEIVERPQSGGLLSSENNITGSALGDVVLLVISLPTLFAMAVAAYIISVRYKKRVENERLVARATQEAHDEVYGTWQYDDGFDDLEPQEPAGHAPPSAFTPKPEGGSRRSTKVRVKGNSAPKLDYSMLAGEDKKSPGSFDDGFDDKL